MAEYQPWTGHNKHSCAIFEDDFVHSVLSFAFHKQSPSSEVTLREDISQRQGKITTNHHLALSLPLTPTHSLHALFKPNYYRVMYQHTIPPA